MQEEQLAAILCNKQYLIISKLITQTPYLGGKILKQNIETLIYEKLECSEDKI